MMRSWRVTALRSYSAADDLFGIEVTDSPFDGTTRRGSTAFVLSRRRQLPRVRGPGALLEHWPMAIIGKATRRRL